MNVAADTAVWCHVRVATVGVRWVLLLAVAGVSPSGFGGSCRILIAACMSAAFTCVAFLSLSVGFW